MKTITQVIIIKVKITRNTETIFWSIKRLLGLVVKPIISIIYNNYKMKKFGLYCPSFTGQYYTVRAMYNFAYIARHNRAVP